MMMSTLRVFVLSLCVFAAVCLLGTMASSARTAVHPGQAASVVIPSPERP